MKSIENLENFRSVLPGWDVLFRVGAAVAAVYPLVHVPAGRTVLCAGGGSEKSVSQGRLASAAGTGGGDHHHAGAGLRPGGEPALPGLGLPAPPL